LARFGAAANIAISMIPVLVTSNLSTLTLSGAFVLCCILSLVSGAVIMTVVPRQVLSPSPIVWTTLLTFPRVLWPAMLTTLLLGVGFGAYLSYVPILAERRDITSLGWVYTVYGIAIIATRMLTGTLLDRPDRREVLWPSAVMMAAGMLCFAYATDVWWLCVAAVLTASSGGVWHPALIAIHVDSISQRGRATAAFYLAFDLGIGVGTWMLAAALQYAGIGAVFAMAAAITLLAGVCQRWIVVVQPR
jgi:predicted MFS family arabinose efflux permease